MIKLSNGHEIEFLTASGAAGYDGNFWPHEQPLVWTGFIDTSLFTHVMKTVTRHRRKGNFRPWKPWDTVKFIWRNGKIVGVANAYGLSNPGFDWWVKNVGPKVDSKKVKLIGSIFGEPEELREMAKILNDFDLVALEYNASCPNSNDDTLTNTGKVIQSCEIIAGVTRHPLIIKLSVIHGAGKIVPVTESMVEAFDINSIPWAFMFPNTKSPLAKYGGGGASGEIAQSLTWGFASTLKKFTKVPVIAPSMWNYEDIFRVKGMGLKVFSFGSVFMPFPHRPTKFVRRYIENKGKE